MKRKFFSEEELACLVFASSFDLQSGKIPIKFHTLINKMIIVKTISKAQSIYLQTVII